ncbi:MAG: glycosyltransferase, partial [Chloroflexota bacterium]|nr:glycosyltransferase [Chloroflexota bacterium]
MRIGLVTGEYPPDVGGVGDHTHRLAHELAARGHAVHVVTSARRGADPAATAGSLDPESSGVMAEDSSAQPPDAIDAITEGS